jgi:DNA-binding LytR/AlgR family response regulator
MTNMNDQSKDWVLVVEDETRLRDEFVAQLSTHFADFTSQFAAIKTAATVEEALVLCRDGDPAVAFIDIRLPGTSGLKLAQLLGRQTLVVMVTAHEEHALEAFTHGAADYLLKPATQARLATCVERLNVRLSERISDRISDRLNQQPQPRTLTDLQVNAAQQPGDAPTGYLQWLAASAGRKTYLIAIEDVIYLKSDNKYTRVVCKDREHLIEEPLKAIVPRLDPNHFRQVHRSAAVNLREVLLVERDDSGAGDVKFRNHTEVLRISAPYMRELKMFLV